MHVLDVSRTEYLALPKGKQDALRLSMHTQSGIENVADLRKRILGYIYANSLNNMPVTREDINRRWSRPAKRIGTNVTDMIRELLLEDVVCMLERGRVYVLFSHPIYKEIIAYREANEIEGDLASDLIDGFIQINS